MLTSLKHTSHSWFSNLAQLQLFPFLVFNVLKYLYIIDNSHLLHEWIVVKDSFVFCVLPFHVDVFLSYYRRFLVLSSIIQLLVLFSVLLESIRKVLTRAHKLNHIL